MARTLQTAKSSSTIRHIRDNQGTLFSKNQDIAKQFKTFYSKPYNLIQDNPDPNSSDHRSTQIKDFLAQYCPKPITTQQAEATESPLSTEERYTAIKQMKVGKSPKPDSLTLLL